MRVIAGSAKHLPLKSVPGMNTRPTTDKIKETLFNILQQQVYDSRFLDLFAGTGGIGIEALSRGAEFAVFVDSARAAQKCIRENLEFTGFYEKSLIFGQDLLPALRSIEKLEPFDVVFMDPPYGKELEKDALTYLSDSTIITEDSLIIAEADLHTEFDYADELGYEITRVKKYKTNMHVFLRKKAE
jgi:16S rRNA (guanine966-N2)-methyltransferase